MFPVSPIRESSEYREEMVMNRKILVIGSTNTDLVIKTERLPEPGETITGGVFETFAGGKSPNKPDAGDA